MSRCTLTIFSLVCFYAISWEILPFRCGQISKKSKIIKKRLQKCLGYKSTYVTKLNYVNQIIFLIIIDFLALREKIKDNKSRVCLKFIFIYPQSKNKQRKRISLRYSFVKAISCAKKLLTLASVKGYSNGLDRENNGRCAKMASCRTCCRGNRKNIFFPILSKTHFYRAESCDRNDRRDAQYTHVSLHIVWRGSWSSWLSAYETQSQRRFRP